LKSRRYEIEITREADHHLSKMTARDRTTVLDSLEEQLAHEPTVETRNRKHLRPNPVAPWELRIGHLRVCSDVETEPCQVVTIEAVGVKDHDRVYIGGEELVLK